MFFEDESEDGKDREEYMMHFLVIYPVRSIRIENNALTYRPQKRINVIMNIKKDSH